MAWLIEIVVPVMRRDVERPHQYDDPHLYRVASLNFENVPALVSESVGETEEAFDGNSWMDAGLYTGEPRIVITPLGNGMTLTMGDVESLAASAKAMKENAVR